MAYFVLILAYCLCLLPISAVSYAKPAQNTNPGTPATVPQDPAAAAEAELNNAQNYFRSRKYPEAKAKVEALLKSPYIISPAGQASRTKADSLLADITAAEAQVRGTELALAKKYSTARKYPEALKIVEAVIKSSPAGSPTRKEADSLFAEILTAEAQASGTELAIARKYLTVEKYPEAQKKVEAVIKSSPPDSTIRKEADSLLADILAADTQATQLKGILTEVKLPKEKQITWWQLFLKDLWVALKLLLQGLILFFGLWGVSKLYIIIKRKFTNQYAMLQFRDPFDNTQLGVLEQFVANLHQWRESRTSSTGGLLRLEVPQTPFPIPLSPLPGEKISPDLETLPAIGPVPLAGVGKFINDLRRKASLCYPWVEVRFSKEATGPIVAQVTLQREHDRVAWSSCWPEKCQDAPEVATLIEAAQQGVESLAFKVICLLDPEKPSLAQAEASDQMRQGMVLLNQYLAGGQGAFAKLKESREKFRKVRMERPDFLAVYFYEGIALDLLGEHNQAARDFEFVKQKTEGKEDQEDLWQRAAFNEAVAHLRNYTPEEVDEAKKILKVLFGAASETKLKTSYLKTLAYAVYASAIAHQLRFWKKVDLAALAEEWQKIMGTLEKINQNPDPAWDVPACQGLDWAIHNARGQFYLHCAIDIPNGHIVPGFDEFTPKTFLAESNKEFQACELLLPSTAETLADLGTLFLHSDDELEKALDYLKRALELNEYYEYAYFRLTQAYEKANNRFMAIRTLQTFIEKSRESEFKRPPAIPKFRDVYERYGIPYLRQTNEIPTPKELLPDLNKPFKDHSELQLLAMTLFGEARSASQATQQGIGHVVINRALSLSVWGSTITEVILRPGAFSSFNQAALDLCKLREPQASDDPVTSPEIWTNWAMWKNCCEDAMAVYARLTQTDLKDPVQGANHYYDTSMPAPDWADEAKFTVSLPGWRTPDSEIRFYKFWC